MKNILKILTGEKQKKVKAKIGKLMRVCPGQRHAWYESNVGIIRIPIKI